MHAVARDAGRRAGRHLARGRPARPGAADALVDAVAADAPAAPRLVRRARALLDAPENVRWVEATPARCCARSPAARRAARGRWPARAPSTTGRPTGAASRARRRSRRRRSTAPRRTALRRVAAGLAAQAGLEPRLGPRLLPLRPGRAPRRGSSRRSRARCSRASARRDARARRCATSSHADDVGEAFAALVCSDVDGRGQRRARAGRGGARPSWLVAARVPAAGLVRFGALPPRPDDPPFLVADIRRLDEVGGRPRAARGRHRPCSGVVAQAGSRRRPGKPASLFSGKTGATLCDARRSSRWRPASRPVSTHLAIVPAYNEAGAIAGRRRHPRARARLRRRGRRRRLDRRDRAASPPAGAARRPAAVQPRHRRRGAVRLPVRARARLRRGRPGRRRRPARPRHIPELLARCARPGVNMVSGSRFLAADGEGYRSSVCRRARDPCLRPRAVADRRSRGHRSDVGLPHDRPPRHRAVRPRLPARLSRGRGGPACCTPTGSRRARSPCRCARRRRRVVDQLDAVGLLHGEGAAGRVRRYAPRAARASSAGDDAPVAAEQAI